MSGFGSMVTLRIKKVFAWIAAAGILLLLGFGVLYIAYHLQ